MHKAQAPSRSACNLPLLVISSFVLAGCLGGGGGSEETDTEIQASSPLSASGTSSTTPPAGGETTSNTNLFTDKGTTSTADTPFTITPTSPPGSGTTSFAITPTTGTGTSNDIATFYNELYKFLADYFKANTPPPPPPSTCASKWGDFRAGNWPAACWRPFSDDSPFNRLIPTNPKLAANSAQLVAWLNSGTGNPNALQVYDVSVASQDDYAHPTYYSSPSDPEFTIEYTTNWGPFTLPAGSKIRIPDAAKPAGGFDHHLTVADQTSGFVYSFFGVTQKPAGGGVLKAASGGQRAITSQGIGTPGYATGGTAAGYSNLAGIIRAQELVGGEINHALFTIVNCSATNWVWPAIQGAYICPGDPGIPNGTHFYLDMSIAEINALAVPAWKKTILRAMATYGMFVGDTSGPSGPRWRVQVESGQTYTSLGYPQPLVEFAQQQGIPLTNGQYRFDLKDGVDWTRLKVLDPCVARGTCANNG